MEKQQIISELLDGSLPIDNESSIFADLSSDSILRDEFRQQLEIKNSVKRDIKAFVPRAESTVRIFTELGIAGTLVGVASYGSRLGAFFSKYAQAIYGVASTSLVAVATYFGLMSAGVIGNDTSNNGNAKNDLQNYLHSSTAFVEDTIYTTREIEKDNSKIVYRDRYIYSNNPAKLSGDEKLMALADKKVILDYENHLNDEHSIEAINKIINSNLLQDNSENNIIDNNSTNQFVALSLSNNKSNNNFELNKSNYQIERYNGDMPVDNSYFDFVSLPVNVNIEVSLASLTDNGSFNFTGNNFRIAAGVDLSQDFSVGLDFRRENYIMYDEIQDLAGDWITTTSYPNFNFYSMMLRYAPSELSFEKIHPFIQFSGGFSDKGSIGRLMLGSSYFLTKNVSLMVGYNYNSFEPYVGYEGLQISNSSFQFGAAYKIFKD